MKKRPLPSLPILVLALVAALGCSGDAKQAIAKGSPVELTIYAATSTRDVLQGLEAAYERQHGVELVFNFGSSGDLANQIVAAAQADVFLSADEKEMDEVEEAALAAAGTRRALLSNQLVVIEPADGPSVFTSPFDPGQLARAEVELLSLANVETVPAGRYAKAWLERRGVWSAVAGRILPGVDVRAALAAVESAGAQAGIVYRTDVARSVRARTVHAVPVEEGPMISYPIAVLAGRPHEIEARAFADFLASPAAGAAFAEAGFVFLPAQGGLR
jgi:molybdate transport system substrate-binding protein